MDSKDEINLSHSLSKNTLNFSNDNNLDKENDWIDVNYYDTSQDMNNENNPSISESIKEERNFKVNSNLLVDSLNKEQKNENNSDIFLTSPLMNINSNIKTLKKNINEINTSNSLTKSNINNISKDTKILNENLFVGRGFRTNKEEFEKEMSIKLGTSFTVESSLMSSQTLSNFSFIDKKYLSLPQATSETAGYDFKNLGKRCSTRRFKHCLIRNKNTGLERGFSASSSNNPMRKSGKNFLAPINRKTNTNICKSIDLKKKKENEKNFQIKKENI